ncbi:MAG: hypothetical protein PHE32_04025 [Candidatus Shapirobacteria bacterium]|nr:hypothetical protein [Candidatus Shapirobacteria bacterium]
MEVKKQKCGAYFKGLDGKGTCDTRCQWYRRGHLCFNSVEKLALRNKKNTYPYLDEKLKETVDFAIKNKANIVSCVDGYISGKEALILKDFLWYARDNGITVVFVPKEEIKNV